MSFGFPVALALLLPWTWVVWRCFRGAVRPAAVPHLRLWPRSRPASGSRGRRPPPWPVVLMLLGLLAAVGSVSQPAVQVGVRSDLAIDTGPTLPPERLAAAGVAATGPPSSLPVDLSAAAAAGRAVFSDQPSAAAVRLVPSPVDNRGIARFAARGGVALVVTDAREVTITGGGTSVSAMPGDDGVARVTLPPAMRSAAVLRAAISRDAVPADDVAWAVRTGGARVTVAGDVPDAAARFAAVWNRLHDGDEVVTLGEDVTFGGEAVAAGDVEVAVHPVAADIDWPKFLAGRRLGRVPAGHEAVVRVGGVAVVGITADGVHVGVALDPATPDGVTLLANTVEHVAGVGGGHVGGSVADVRAGWTHIEGDASTADYQPRPGVYRDADGALRAANVARLTTDLATPAGSPDDVFVPRTVELGWPLAVAAGMLWVAGLMFWSGRGRFGSVDGDLRSS